MTKFSANLGFLWADLPLPEAIRAARAAGFDAVECHYPYDVPATEVAAALADTGLQMLSLNTRRGNVRAGDMGLSALPERTAEARAAIDEVVAYAAAIRAKMVHVLAGFSDGPQAREVFVANLEYACAAAERHGVGVLIEPLNPYDAPGYFLRSTEQAKDIIAQVGAENIALMFDCYHVQLIEGDLSHKLAALQPIIGHIQFASVPDRAAPDHGEVAYGHIFNVIREMGYTAPLGAEYRPGDDTEKSLAWMTALRRSERA